MTKNKLSNSSGKKDLLIKESSKIFTKLCISKWNSKTLVKSFKESVKSCHSLITVNKITDENKK